MSFHDDSEEEGTTTLQADDLNSIPDRYGQSYQLKGGNFSLRCFKGFQRTNAKNCLFTFVLSLWRVNFDYNYFKLNSFKLENHSLTLIPVNLPTEIEKSPT